MNNSKLIKVKSVTDKQLKQLLALGYKVWITK